MSPRAKYNNRTDSQAGQSFSQVLLERQSDKPSLFSCLWKRMAHEQLPTCFSTHTGRCWGKWKRRTHPTGCKLNHVDLGKENPIRAAKLSVSDERCCFQSQRLSKKLKLLRRYSGHSDNYFKMAERGSLDDPRMKREPEALNHS